MQIEAEFRKVSLVHLHHAFDHGLARAQHYVQVLSGYLRIAKHAPGRVEIEGVRSSPAGVIPGRAFAPRQRRRYGCTLVQGLRQVLAVEGVVECLTRGLVVKWWLRD